FLSVALPPLLPLFPYTTLFRSVGADHVHLVNEDEPRHLVLVGLAPDRLRLGLDALLGVEDDDAAVEDAERALHFRGEVHVAGRVDRKSTRLNSSHQIISYAVFC